MTGYISCVLSRDPPPLPKALAIVFWRSGKRMKSAGDGNGALFWGENFCTRKQTRYGSYNSRKKLKPSRIYIMLRRRVATAWPGKCGPRDSVYADRLFYCASCSLRVTRVKRKLATVSYDANGFFSLWPRSHTRTFVDYRGYRPGFWRTFLRASSLWRVGGLLYPVMLSWASSA